MALGDMFLKLDSAKQGPIKGEAQDEKHKEEIELIGWGWGMRAQTAMGGGGATGKATVHELNIIKRVDSASTGLMSAMRNNDVIKKAVLTVRKAGGTPLDYLKITTQNGRITVLDVQSGESGSEAELIEKLSLAFQKICVEYVPQGADGQPRGGMMFETEIS
jgi:type VI secretion system secreted protein Hcp